MSKSGAGSPPTEVKAQASRRRFSAKYKKAILEQVAACKAPGELGALLRREGLYSSHLTNWRRQVEQGELAGLEPKKRGPVPRIVDRQDQRLAELEKELGRMTRGAERAEALVEFQKKSRSFSGSPCPASRTEHDDGGRHRARSKARY